MDAGAPPTPEDRDLVRIQLGRLRYEPRRILARCRQDRPAVVLGYHPPGPPVEGETLSTSLTWVSCPWLERRIQGLENSGWIDHLRWILEHPANKELRERMLSIAEDYTNRVREAFDARRPDLFEKRFGGRIMGVGGTQDPLALKCLHNHVAWSLAGGDSPIGRFALALVDLDLAPGGLGATDCGRDCGEDPGSFGLEP